MTTKYDSQSCTVTSQWEWGQNGGSGGSKTVTESGISVSAHQEWAWDGGDWNPVGSMVIDTTSYYYDKDGYSGNIPLQSHNATVSAPSYSGSYINHKVTTYGGGTGTFSGTVTQTASYSWGATSSTHNHDSSISYDDGTYAGTLTFDSCSGSAPSPTSSGAYVGDVASTVGTGTAYYSGEVSLKDNGGGGTDPTPSLTVVAKNITDTSVTATIENLYFESSYYHMFEAELWFGNEEYHIITESWADPGNLKYTSINFTILEPNTTYTIKGFTKSTSTSGRNHAGTVSFTTIATVNTRPDDWTWTTLSNSNSVYEMGNFLQTDIVLASEWISFLNRINQFRKYKSLGDYTFSSIVSKSQLTDNVYEEARLAISDMTSVPSSVSTGETNVNQKVMALSNALNSII